MNRQMKDNKQSRNRPNYIYKYDKGGISNHLAERAFLVQVLAELNSYLEKHKIRFIPHTIHKNELQKHERSNCKK